MGDFERTALRGVLGLCYVSSRTHAGGRPLTPMDWKQRYLARLPEHLDDKGDLAPPWERFPHYERYTIGWRMGTGEDWLGLWHVFLETLDPAFEARLSYLRRHPAAPITWAKSVHDVLYPSSRDDADEDEDGDRDGDGGGERGGEERRAALLEMGLIASDVAYSTWLRQQEGVRWPWTYGDTPEYAARYLTRDMEFWSRQVAGLRSDPGWKTPQLPDEWESCAAPLATGDPRPLDLDRGLLSLARSLAAGRVAPPWELGLGVDDFADSFEDDMGYVDAFRLWGMSVFDDREHLQRYLGPAGMPERWGGWIAEHFAVD